MFRRRSRPARHVVLYSRPGCHLCEDARALLEEIARRRPLQIEEIDITSDPALVRAYDIRIPVLVVDGTVELSAPLDPDSVRRALK